jgi:hypothetical protein
VHDQAAQRQQVVVVHVGARRGVADDDVGLLAQEQGLEVESELQLQVVGALRIVEGVAADRHEHGVRLRDRTR